MEQYGTRSGWDLTLGPGSRRTWTPRHENAILPNGPTLYLDPLLSIHSATTSSRLPALLFPPLPFHAIPTETW